MIFHIFLIFLSQNKHIFSLYYYCKQQMQLLNISFSFSYFFTGSPHCSRSPIIIPCCSLLISFLLFDDGFTNTTFLLYYYSNNNSFFGQFTFPRQLTESHTLDVVAYDYTNLWFYKGEGRNMTDREVSEQILLKI